MVGAATWLTGGMLNGRYQSPILWFLLDVDWYPHRIVAPRYSDSYPGMVSTRPLTSVLYNQVAELLFPSHPRVQIEGDVLGHHSLLRAEGAQTDTKKNVPKSSWNF